VTTAIKPFYEIDTDGHLKLNLHRGQTLVYQDSARIVCLLCGSQYGKTTMGPCWLHREMYQEDGETPIFGDYLAVTATFPLLRLKMLPELQKYFTHYLKWGEWKSGDKVFDSHLRHHGAPAQRIIIGSATSPESLESATAIAAWLDEAGQHQFTREAWEAIQARLTISEGRILITTTPYEWGWFKAEIYDRWMKGDMSISVIQGDSKDNPAFPLEEYERQKTLLPRWKFRMRYQGQFEKPAGLIYDTFDSDTCLIPRTWYKPPERFISYVGHDFGPNNTAAVWWAVDPDTGYAWIYRTYHEGGLSHFQHAQKWKALSETETILKRVGGALAEDGQREACRAAGWPISKPKERSVEAGIMSAYSWINENRIFVFDDLTEFVDELQSYSYELDDNYEVKQPTNIKDKSSFHLMDCIRYGFSDMTPERLNYNQKVKVVSHQRGQRHDELPEDFSELRAVVKRH